MVYALTHTKAKSINMNFYISRSKYYIHKQIFAKRRPNCELFLIENNRKKINKSL